MKPVCCFSTKVLIFEPDPTFANLISTLLHSLFLKADWSTSISIFQSPKTQSSFSNAPASPFDLVIFSSHTLHSDITTFLHYLQIRNPEIKIIYLAFSPSEISFGYSLHPFSCILVNSHFKKNISIAINDFIDFSRCYQGLYLLKTKSQLYLLPLKDIIYIEAQKRTVIFVSSTGEAFECYQKISTLEKELSRWNFIRIQKSFLVNKNRIISISNHSVLLDYNIELPISNKFIDVDHLFITSSNNQ